MHGLVNKLLMEGVDSLVTGPLTTAKEEVRQRRRDLTRRCHALEEELQTLHGDVVRRLSGM